MDNRRMPPNPLTTLADVDTALAGIRRSNRPCTITVRVTLHCEGYEVSLYRNARHLDSELIARANNPNLATALSRALTSVSNTKG